MDAGLGILLIRLVGGVLLAGHGAQQLFGWFGGNGLTGTARFFDRLGWRPGLRYAVLGGSANLLAGVLLGVGLFTVLGAALAVTMMGNAIGAVYWRHGLWAQRGGFEYPLTLVVLVLSVAVTGPGPYSVAAVTGIGRFAGLPALAGTLLVCAVGVVAGQWLRRHRVTARGSEQASTR